MKHLFVIGFKVCTELRCRYLSYRCLMYNGVNPCNVLKRPITQNIYLPFHVVSHQVLLRTLVTAAFISSHRFMQRWFRYEEEESLAQIQISVTDLFPKSLTPFFWKSYPNPLSLPTCIAPTYVCCVIYTITYFI